MNSIEQAFEQLYEALGGVSGLLVVRGVGVALAPPAVVVAPPTLRWGAFDEAPTEASFVVAVVVAQTPRAHLELAELVGPVHVALEAAGIGAVGDTAEPGTWPAGGGSELPAYLISVEVGLR